MKTYAEIVAERDNPSENLIADLELGLQIDENGLDEALQQQPDLFYRVSKEYALCLSRRDAVKQYLEEVKSSLLLDAKEEARDNKERTTESEIDALVRTNRKFKEVNQELLDINRELGLWTALKDAYTKRGYALSSLVELWIANYYGDASQRSTKHQLREAQGDANRQKIKRFRMKQREEADSGQKDW